MCDRILCGLIAGGGTATWTERQTIREKSHTHVRVVAIAVKRCQDGGCRERLISLGGQDIAI
jgi:hypothetical protein